jgi:hypothetical protein
MYHVKDLSKIRRFDRNKICGTKKRFDTLDTAFEAAQLANTSDENITLYRCPVCKYWHFGRKDKNNRGFKD